MIIQSNSILSLIHRHVQKYIVHITRPVIAENHMLIVISTYVKPSWSRGGFPTQLLGIGGEVVELDGPRKLHERVGPGDEFLRGNMIMVFLS